MKAISLLSVLAPLLCPVIGVSQTFQPPREEYQLIASANTLTIAKGQQDSVTLTVVRSKVIQNWQVVTFS
jgi:hypothetical protein